MNNYRLRKRSDAAAFPPMDGIAMDSVNGVLVAAGGWNGGLTPTLYNTIFESADGITWNQEADAPWNPKHTFGHGVKANNWIYYWGSDAYATPGSGKRREVHRYNQSTGVHELVTADWGSSVGDRVLFSSCIHKDYLYVLGGQEDLTSESAEYNDIYRSLDGVTWTKVSDLPAGMHGRSRGAFISTGVNLFFIGGAKYGTPHSNYGSDMWRSTDDGVTWTQVVSSGNNHLKGIYAQGVYWDGKLWFMKGFHDGRNRPGLVYIDPVTYEINSINYNILGRHAQSMCVHVDSLMVAAGSANAAIMNDVWEIIRL